MPVNFPIPSEVAIASYDYQDVADGTGIVSFYGSKVVYNAVTDYILTSDVIFSSEVKLDYTGIGGGASFALAIDYDFDVMFNVPKRVKGIARINDGWGVATDSATPSTLEAYIIFKLRKWDGSTETEIANITTETLSIGDDESSYKVLNLPVEIATLVNFKIGETLRLTVEVWVKGSGAGNHHTFLGYDPKDRIEDTEVLDTTQLKLNIPFILDL
jgi:hypothetical protein